MITSLSNKTIIPVLITLAVAGSVGFFAGTTYQQKQQASFRQFAGNLQPGNGMGMIRDGNRTADQRVSGTINMGNRMGFRPVSGEIISADEKSITVKMPDGSSKIVLISQTTNINTASQANKTDLTVGTTVAVFGQTNSDGSVTATNIQLNPMLQGQGFGMPPQGGQNTNPPLKE